MAYCKIVLNTGSTLAHSTDVFNVIKEVVDGTIDSQADLEGASYSTGVNLGASSYYGTKPTAGIYSIAQHSSGGTNSASWYAYTQIKKYHYAKDQVSGFDPFHYIWLDTNDDYGFRWTVQDAGLNWRIPSSSGRNRKWTSSTNDTEFQVGTETMYAIVNIHLIVNDTTFALWVEDHSTNANGEVAWMADTDHEFIQTTDTYLHAAEATWYPGSTHWGHWTNTLNAAAGDAAGTTSEMHAHGSMRFIYLDASGGTWRTPSMSDESEYHWHPYKVHGHIYGSTWPAPVNDVRNMKATSGDVHPLIPINYMGQFNDTVANGYGDPTFARCMNWYRTTNNLTMGTRLKIGNDYYRVFRGWNCGDPDINDASQKGCVAFPENNVPY